MSYDITEGRAVSKCRDCGKPQVSLHHCDRFPGQCPNIVVARLYPLYVLESSLTGPLSPDAQRWWNELNGWTI
jgi:hypothetical protein